MISSFSNLLAALKRFDKQLEEKVPFGLVDKFGKVIVVVGAVTFLWTWDATRKQQIVNSNLQSWQILGDTENQPASYARSYALGNLLKNGASLRGVDLDNVWVEYLNAYEPNFSYASLRNTKIFASDLRKANFSFATLQGAAFVDSDLRGANFEGANLERVTFLRSKIDGATFHNVSGFSCALVAEAESARGIDLGSLQCK